MNGAPSKTLMVAPLVLAFAFATVGTEAQSSAQAALEVNRSVDTVDAALHSEIDGQLRQPSSSSVSANLLPSNFSLHNANQSSETAARQPSSRRSGYTVAGYRDRYGQAECIPDIGHPAGVQERSSFSSFSPLTGQKAFTKWQAAPSTASSANNKNNKNNKTNENEEAGDGSLPWGLGPPVNMLRTSVCMNVTASELPAASFQSARVSGKAFDSTVPFCSARLGATGSAPFEGTRFSTHRHSASTERHRPHNRQSESVGKPNPWLESLRSDRH